MKTKITLTVISSLLALSASSFAADKKIDAKSAKASCKTLIDAVKSGDIETVERLTAQQAVAKDQQKMTKSILEARQKYMSKLKDFSCGSEMTVGTHAVVEAKGPDENRIVP